MIDKKQNNRYNVGGGFMTIFLYYFLLFIIYSFLGWCIESIYCMIEQRKVVSRGFLIGPYCPIYGWGALIMIFTLQRYLNDPIVLFVMGALVASVIEYITSLVMEKIFHARWWDYSHMKFNVNGRICLTNFNLTKQATTQFFLQKLQAHLTKCY